MYIFYCKDPNCVNCKEGHSSQKENPNKIAMTLEESLSRELFTSCVKKASCLEAYGKVKEEIHNHFIRLIDVLREREQNLCKQVEKECCTQMAKIDHDATVRCIDTLLKKNSNAKKDSCRTALTFNCEIDSLLCQLEMFGQLNHENVPAEELPKAERTLPEDISLSTPPLDSPLETRSKDEMDKVKLKILNESIKDGQFLKEQTDSKLSEEDNSSRENLQSLMGKEQSSKESADSTSNKEIEEDSSLDESDMVIISKSEAVALPSETVCLPAKYQFSRAKKRPFFPFQFSKKPSQLTENNSPEFYVCTHKELPCLPTSSMFKCPISLTEQEMLIASSNEQENPKSSIKSLVVPESSVTSTNRDKERNKFATWLASIVEQKKVPPLHSSTSSATIPVNRGSEGLERRYLDTSGTFLSEQKKAPSPSQCLGNSRVEIQGHNPSVALLSSFKKYLEKNPEDNWLVSEKKPLTYGNHCIFNSNMPFLVDNIEQWLPTKKLAETDF